MSTSIGWVIVNKKTGTAEPTGHHTAKLYSTEGAAKGALRNSYIGGLGKASSNHVIVEAFIEDRPDLP